MARRRRRPPFQPLRQRLLQLRPMDLLPPLGLLVLLRRQNARILQGPGAPQGVVGGFQFGPVADYVPPPPPVAPAPQAEALTPSATAPSPQASAPAPFWVAVAQGSLPPPVET